MLLVRMAREIPGSLDIHGDLLMLYQTCSYVMLGIVHKDLVERVVQNLVLFAHPLCMYMEEYRHIQHIL